LKYFGLFFLFAIVIAVFIFDSFYFETETPVFSEPVKLKDKINVQGEKHSLDVIFNQTMNDFDSLQRDLCKDSFSSVDYSKKEVNHKQGEISNLIIQQAHNGANDNLLDYISVISGIGLYKSRWIVKNESSNRNNGTIIDSALASIQDIQFFTNNIKGLEIEELLFRISKGDVASAGLYLIDGKLQSILSYLINQFEFFSEAQIYNIIDSNLVPNEADLAIATSKGLDNKVINKLYNNSNIDAAHIFREKLIYQSYSSLALKSGNLENVLFWLDLGSPLNPDPFAMSKVEFLNKEKHKYGFDDLQKILRKSFRDNFHPNSYHTLSADYGFSYKELSKFHFVDPINQSISTLGKTIANKVVNQIFSIAIPQKLNSMTEKSPCFLKLGKYSTALIFRNFAKKYGGQYEYTTKVIKTDYSNKIKIAKETYAEQVDIERHLFDDGSLDGKLAVEQYRREVIKEVAKSLLNEISSDEELNELHQNMEKVIQLAIAGKWDEALLMLKKIGVSSQEALDGLMYLALSFDAPLSFISQLVDLGGHLPDTSIRILIEKNAIGLAKKLRKYGLKLDYSIPSLFEPITYTVSSGTVDMLRFLLENGVSMPSHDYGLDPLDIVLRDFNISTSDPEFIYVLLNAGAIIQDSHFQLVLRLQETDPISFNYIKKNFPELII